MDTRFRLFPEDASTAARHVDYLYFFLLAVSAFFTILIFVLIVYFALKYRRGVRTNRTIALGQRFWILEVTWALIPLGLTMIMFAWGADLFFQMSHAPPDCLEINAIGKQWMWKVQHPNGKQEINTLHVPTGRPVRVRLISEDVIHSFYIPSFRVKQDVLPGRYTSLWFEATKPGRYHLFCAEYCGTSHSLMRGEVIVQEPSEYANWLQGGTAESPEVAGRRLFEEFRCDSCHRDSADARCPPLTGIFGRTVRLQDGSTVVADEDYLRESILNPSAKVVAGYQPVMPTYQGQIGEEGIYQLIAYLKTLRASAPDAEEQDEPQDAAPRRSEPQP